MVQLHDLLSKVSYSIIGNDSFVTWKMKWFVLLCAGMDECGVCNGNGSSCQDCSREPNGNKVKDHCGNCFPKNHPSFNNCTKFIDFPSCWAIKNELEIKVIGVRGYRASECSFVLNSLQ